MFTTDDPFGARDPFSDRDPFTTADSFATDLAGGSCNGRWAGNIRDLLAQARLETRRPAMKPVTGGWSWPIYTDALSNDVIGTVIAVEYRGSVAFQLYAVEAGNWSLVGFFGLYVDALAELNNWRRYIAVGGSLQSWMAAHPDGVRADVGSVTR